MADRSVKVSLILQAQGYVQGMDAAAKKTRDLGTEQEKLARKAQSFETMGRAALAVGVAAAAGVAVATAKFVEFDKQMSYVQAATHETAANMELLRDAAMDAGARTVYSASEAAMAIEELAKAGVSTADILSGGLDGALDAAAAGGMAVAETAELMASTLKQFQLDGTDAAHVADLLAAAAGKAQGGMQDMGAALSQAGLVANQFGIPVEEAVGALAAFANAGMMGSDAGTSLRTMLLRLANPTGEVAELMKDIGFNAYDANGQFIGMEKLAGELESSLAGMTQEQKNQTTAMIFGQDAIRGANVLLKEGAQGIQEWTDKVNDQGYAAETAAIRLDNLAGDWEEFTGSLETAFISMGEGANGPLRDFIQGLTDMVNWFNDWPEWAQQLVIVGGAAVAILGGLGGAALLAIPKLAAFKAAMTDLDLSLKKFSLIGGGITLAIGLVISAVTALAGAHAEAEARADSYAASLDKGAQATAETYSQIADKMLEDQDTWDLVFADRWLSGADAARMLGMSVTDVTKIIADGGKDFEDLSKQVEDLKNNTDGAADALANKLGVSTTEVRDAAFNLLPVLKTEGDLIQKGKDDAAAKADAMGGLADETEGAGAVAETAAQQYFAEADALSSLDRELNALLDSFNELNGTNQDAISKNLAYQETLRDVRDHISELQAGAEGYAYGLDLSTEAGSRNMQMLLDLAKDSQTAAEGQFALDQSAQGYMASLQAGRQELIDSAIAMGATAEEAQALADKIYAIPPEREIEILAETAAAQSAVDGLLNGIPDFKTVTVQVAAENTFNAAASWVQDLGGGSRSRSGGVREFAAGGWSSGPGIAKATPGGLIRVAEANYDEAIITTDPKHRNRSLQIYDEIGSRIGAPKPAPAPFYMSGGGGSSMSVSAPITITAMPGMDEGLLARKTAENLNYQLKKL